MWILLSARVPYVRPERTLVRKKRKRRRYGEIVASSSSSSVDEFLPSSPLIPAIATVNQPLVPPSYANDPMPDFDDYERVVERRVRSEADTDATARMHAELASVPIYKPANRNSWRWIRANDPVLAVSVYKYWRNVARGVGMDEILDDPRSLGRIRAVQRLMMRSRKR